MFSGLFGGRDKEAKKREESHGLREDGRHRLPPGQSLTAKWPVLHYGGIPRIDLATWRFRVWGAVEAEKEWDWNGQMALPRTERTNDVHCVTRWSKFENRWEGVAIPTVMEGINLLPDATHVLVHSFGGYTTNLPLDEFLRPDNLLADRHGGEPLSDEHGWPLRLVVPELYFWKSAKWVNGFQFLTHDQRGFWEQYGYHNHGDPWEEERFG